MNLRVAHILRKYNPAEWGGTESALQLLLPALREQGVGADIYAPRIPMQAAADPLAADGARIHRYRALLPVLGMPRVLRRQLTAVGGNILAPGLPFRLLRNRGLDLIHSHALGRVGGAALLAARISGLPFVTTIHGGVLDLPPGLRKAFEGAGARGFDWGRAFGWLLQTRRLLEKADAVLTCNPREAALLRERYPDQRVIVQPHGVAAARFAEDHRAAALPLLGGQADRKVVLCLGRVDPVKNQRWLVEQAGGFLRRDPASILILVGACTDPVYGAELKSLIARLGLANRVLLPGALPPGDPRLIGLLQSAAAVIVPSISETFGLVILEAWAAGAPVLSSRTSGAESLIRSGEDGWLFDLENGDEFQALIGRTLQEPGLATRLADRGRERVRNEFDQRVLASRLKGLYAELCDRSRTRAVVKEAVA